MKVKRIKIVIPNFHRVKFLKEFNPDDFDFVNLDILCSDVPIDLHFLPVIYPLKGENK